MNDKQFKEWMDLHRELNERIIKLEEWKIQCDYVKEQSQKMLRDIGADPRLINMVKGF